MVTTLLLAAACTATATTPIPALKADFEEKACQAEEIVKATLKGTKDVLEIEMNVNVNRATLKPDPFRTVRAGQTAQSVLAYVNKTFKFFPPTFQWTVNDKNGKYMCTIRIEEGVVSGDCGGIGKP